MLFQPCFTAMLHSHALLLVLLQLGMTVTVWVGARAMLDSGLLSPSRPLSRAALRVCCPSSALVNSSIASLDHYLEALVKSVPWQ